MTVANSDKIVEIKNYLRKKSIYEEDRWGNFKFQQMGKFCRFKFQTHVIRKEVKTDNGQWVRVASYNIKSVYLNLRAQKKI